jgi:hypothetical protein
MENVERSGEKKTNLENCPFGLALILTIWTTNK